MLTCKLLWHRIFDSPLTMLALESQLDALARYDATIMNRHISTGILTTLSARVLQHRWR